MVCYAKDYKKKSSTRTPLPHNSSTCTSNTAAFSTIPQAMGATMATLLMNNPLKRFFSTFAFASCAKILKDLCKRLKRCIVASSFPEIFF
jgi:hypothetical protein